MSGQSPPKQSSGTATADPAASGDESHDAPWDTLSSGAAITHSVVASNDDAWGSIAQLGIPVAAAQIPVGRKGEKKDTVSEAPYRRKPGVRSPSPPEPPPKDKALPRIAVPQHTEVFDEKHLPDQDAIDSDHVLTGDVEDGRSEIQSIMDQFADEANGPKEEEIMSPIRERASFFGQDSAPSSPGLQRLSSRESHTTPSVRMRPPSFVEGLPPPVPPASEKPEQIPPRSPSGASLFQPPPPSPDPEPDLPFDFHRFLEQLRHRTADPVARFLRSFLNEFGKKQWQVHEQVKIIADFLEFISKKMSQCEVWRTVSDAEFDNAREGMEKLVMNRLYSQTFSPAIPPPELPSPSKPRRKAQVPQDAPGRRGQHQEDVERDDIVAQKLRIYGWIQPEHLDIPAMNEKGRKFLGLAQQELRKINSYRAPRDKVIQILNCCKVIFGFLKNNKTDQSADSFVPLLIYTVLQARPAHLASNVQYILRFRNQDKLGGEAGYYISSLMGVISFIETLDRTNLTISDEEFERHVEDAVSAITADHQAQEYEARTSLPSPPASASTPNVINSPILSTPGLAHSPLLLPTEKSTLSRPEVTPRNSLEGERTHTSPRKARQVAPSDSLSPSEDLASNLLRTIGRPLSSIGRMFSDADQHGESPPRQPRIGSMDRGALQTSHDGGDEVLRLFGGRRDQQPPQHREISSQSGMVDGPPAQPTRPVADLAAVDEASIRAESRAEAESQRIRAEDHRLVVETLQGMFPDLDKEVISDVVRMKEGRVGMAVDACLALST